jgi:SAM-dependent methyltransferase
VTWARRISFLDRLRRTRTSGSAGGSAQPTKLDRAVIAQLFLRGSGIEIGALHKPLPVPDHIRVRYVDHADADVLARRHPEEARVGIVPVDVIDNGETLATFADSSVDFVIANHFLEHAEDTLRTLANLFRVLRPGGALYLAIPDLRFTFDRDRPPTPFSHLERDFDFGPAESRVAHYEEWSTLVMKRSAEETAEVLPSYLESRKSIHFHAWTQAELLELFAEVSRRPATRCSVELVARLGEEYVFVLVKGDPPDLARD